jgi:hypothetical protein
MKWVKLGLVFAPHGNHPWMVSHATVPIADFVQDRLVRVYFSTRDSVNRSHVGVMLLELGRIPRVAHVFEEPVIAPGEVGTFDDSGAMSSWVTNYEGRKYFYYIGWNLGVTVPFRNAIGLTISDDHGFSFQKYARGPILDRSPYDPCFTASPCVMFDKGIWRMWYLSCVAWVLEDGKAKHYYHIKYAESEDGILWNRTGKVCIDFRSEAEYAISRPCVLRDCDMYKMWYSYRGETYRIGYAESLNAIDWQRKDEEVGIDVSESGWDSEMIEYPFVFDHDGKRYMLYNGNGFGRTGFGLAVLNE